MISRTFYVSHFFHNLLVCSIFTLRYISIVIAGTSSGISTDGFETCLWNENCLPCFRVLLCHNLSFYWISSKNYGFEKPYHKIDGLTQTDRANANGAPVLGTFCFIWSMTDIYTWWDLSFNNDTFFSLLLFIGLCSSTQADLDLHGDEG